MITLLLLAVLSSAPTAERHRLAGIELARSGRWSEAVAEFDLAISEGATPEHHFVRAGARLVLIGPDAMRVKQSPARDDVPYLAVARKLGEVIADLDTYLADPKIGDRAQVDAVRAELGHRIDLAIAAAARPCVEKGTVRLSNGACCAPGREWNATSRRCTGAAVCKPGFEHRPDLGVVEGCVGIPTVRSVPTRPECATGGLWVDFEPGDLHRECKEANCFARAIQRVIPAGCAPVSGSTQLWCCSQ